MKKTYRLLLLGLMILFVIIGYHRLALPYFWDEMATYAKTTYHLYVHGISLNPSAAPEEFSFGHPLLVPAIIATVYKIFGATVVVSHATCMAFALLLLWATYRFGESFFSPATGLLAALLLMVQPIFVAQSTQLVLEIPFALFTLWGIYFFLKNRFALSTLFACAAIMTKETGLVLPLALMGVEVFNLLTGKYRFRGKSLWLFLPYMVFAIFLLLQKQAHGWYLSPVNMGKTVLHWESGVGFYWDSFKQRWDYCISFILDQQGRKPWLWVALAGILWFVWIQRKHLGKIRFKAFWQQPVTVLHLTLALFAFGMLVFSAINNPLERYLMVLFPIGCLWLVLLIQGFSKLLWIQSIPVAALIVMAVCNMDNGKRYTDVDLSYIHHVKTNLEMAHYLDNDTSFNGKYIYCDWPAVFYLGSKEAGYVKNVRYELKVAGDTLVPKADYYLYTMPGNLESHKPIEGLLPVKSFQSSYARVDLYKVNK